MTEEEELLVATHLVKNACDHISHLSPVESCLRIEAIHDCSGYRYFIESPDGNVIIRQIRHHVWYNDARW